MALSNPRTLAQFFDTLVITSLTWEMKRNDNIEGIGSGQILQSELATPLWTAEVNLPPMQFATARRVRARIESLLGPDKEFFAYDPISEFPMEDPTGSIIAGSTVRINSFGADFDAISLKGLPNGYVLSEGDFFQVSFGGDQTGLFKITEGGTSPAGISTLVSIVPHTFPGMLANDIVTLVKPSAKCIIIPDTYDAGSEDSDTNSVSGCKFSIIQRL